jgi:hypothetical protein
MDIIMVSFAKIETKCRMDMDVTEFLGNQRKTPHPTWKNIIFCHFRLNPEGFIFSTTELIG